MMVVAESDRLLLRHVVESDAGPLNAVFRDVDVMHFGNGPQTADWIQSWITQAIRDYASLGFGLWVVTKIGNSDVIGYCGLTRFPDINGRPEIEIGFRLARDQWGYGLATEAATLVRDLAFGQLEISRLIALIDPENTRSIRVAEKLGMTCEGDVMLDGYTHPDLVYACNKPSRFTRDVHRKIF